MRPIGLFLSLPLWSVACGGAPFTAELYPPEDGGGVVDIEDGGADAFDPSVRLDAQPSQRIDSSDEDSAVSSADGDVCNPNQPIVKTTCGTESLTYPTDICILSVAISGSSAYLYGVTPAACNGWCTFNCACLMVNSATCRLGSLPTACQVLANGGIEVECKQQ